MWQVRHPLFNKVSVFKAFRAFALDCVKSVELSLRGPIGLIHFSQMQLPVQKRYPRIRRSRRPRMKSGVLIESRDGWLDVARQHCKSNTPTSSLCGLKVNVIAGQNVGLC